MLQLTSAVRRTLRARAHHLRPYLSIGEAGLTPGLLTEIDRCLASHELIKVRVLVGDRHGRENLIEQICRELGASPVQQIGRILVIFRPRPEEPVVPATPPPKAVARRQPGARRPQRPSQGKRFRRT